MIRRPKGRKYRNLFARGDVIYYEAVADGKRVKLSTKTRSWDDAASVRDLYEEKYGRGRTMPRAPSTQVPTFGEFSLRYLAEDTAHLAATSTDDRRSLLQRGGRIQQHLGALRLDQITTEHLRTFWVEKVEGKIHWKTGLSALSAIAAVLTFAREIKVLAEDHDPVAAFRQSRRSKSKTQKGRAQAKTNIRPIENTSDITSLVTAAEVESAPAHLLVLILLDAGLRLGEALALQWKHVRWGDGPDDLRRALWIEGSRSRGAREVGPTKSGRDRLVGLSQRLYRLLRHEYERAHHPSPRAFILVGIDSSNFRHREWRRILERAGLSGIALKDLRDTFASQLLTAGVQLGYVSSQLGHADVSVTAKHYAKWCGSDIYTAPIALDPDEIPADILARLGTEVPPIPHHSTRHGLRVVAGRSVLEPREAECNAR